MPTYDFTTTVPMIVNGHVRMVQTQHNGTPKDFFAKEAETVRRLSVEACRLHYAGEQFDAENANVIAAATAAGQNVTGEVPEHLRKHAYSTMIRECIDFIIGRVGAGFKMEANDSKVAEVISAMVEHNEPICGVDEEGDYVLAVDDILREAAVASDIAVRVDWDHVLQAPRLEFWESERVEFRMATADSAERVIRTEVLWITDDTGMERQVTERRVYELRLNLDMFSECVETIWWDSEEEPRAVNWLGVGKIPWTVIRVATPGLREYRGAALITPQIRDAARRFDAVEQTAYLIARYNSHANVAVIGDNALLQVKQDGRIHKDVADVLTFPGGTALQVLSLPTDPQMIQHQRDVLSDSVYAAFGLTRVDPQNVQGMGAVSGYALEILNQKTEVTFSKITRRVRMDMLRFVDLVCDVVAWKRDAVQGYRTTDGVFVPVPDEATVNWDLVPFDVTWVAQWWEVDTAASFPDRKIKITLGTGYVVDEVRVRDDFVANLISQEEALRQRGYDGKAIKRILREQGAKAQADSARVQAENATFAAGLPPSGADVGQTGATSSSSLVGSTVAGGSSRTNGAA